MVRKSSISKRYLKRRWKKFLSQDKDGVLHISGVSVKYLEKKYGTPLYVLVESEIRDRLRRFKDAFPYEKLKVQYASKCNTNLEILRLVREAGMEHDASSVGEIILGLLADFEPEQITFTNLYKSEQDINFAAQIGVQAITADSIEEIKRIGLVGEKLGKKIKIFIRVNPMITLGSYTTKYHQYGIPSSQAKKAVKLALNSEFIDLIGFHFHGSYISTPKIYFIAAKYIIKLAQYATNLGGNIKSIDLGGGFPVAYNSKKVFQPEEMGKLFSDYFKNELVKHGLPEINLIFEPGKFFVANAGIGLVRVISKKRLRRKNVLITDGSTYAFLPDPIVYHCQYDMLPATKMDEPRYDYYDIAGSTCDAIDIIGPKKWLPLMKVNDLVAIMDCGAYSNVMASNFNTLKRAPMVMIKEDGSVKLIRRRDRYSEMFAPELDVLKVADPNELKRFYNLFRLNIGNVWRDSKKDK